MFLATLRRHRYGGESAKHFAFESKTICRRLGVSNRGSLGYVQTSVPIVPFKLPFWVLSTYPDDSSGLTADLAVAQLQPDFNGGIEDNG